jgi:hypothetical protein
MSVEDRLSATLTAHAEGEVNTSSLLTGSVAKGKTLRLRHNGAIALAAAAVLGIAVIIPVALWPERSAQTPGAVPSQVSATSVPMPPVVEGGQTVLQNPAVLGSDPNLLHMSVDALPPRGDAPTGGPYGDGSPSTSWASFAGSEYLALQGPIAVDFYAGQWAVEQTEGLTATRDLTINGKAAKLYASTSGGSSVTRLVLWQPVPGVQVAARGINGTTEDVLIAAAEGLRFDRVGRCAVSFAVTSQPSGAQLYRCDTGFTPSGISANSRQVYHKADGSIMDIRDRGNSPSGQTPNATVAGHPGHWAHGDAQGVSGDMLTVNDLDGHDVSVLINGSFTHQEAEQVVTGLRWH